MGQVTARLTQLNKLIDFSAVSWPLYHAYHTDLRGCQSSCAIGQQSNLHIKVYQSIKQTWPGVQQGMWVEHGVYEIQLECRAGFNPKARVMVPFRSSSIPILLAVQGHPLAQTDRTQKEDEVTAQNNLLFFTNWKGFQSTGSLQQQSRCTSV